MEEFGRRNLHTDTPFWDPQTLEGDSSLFLDIPITLPATYLSPISADSSGYGEVYPQSLQNQVSLETVSTLQNNATDPNHQNVPFHCAYDIAFEGASDMYGLPQIHSPMTWDAVGFPQGLEVEDSTFAQVEVPNSGQGSRQASKPAFEDKSKATDYECSVCGVKESTYPNLVSHVSFYYHATLHCRFQPCAFVYSHIDSSYKDHLKTAHPETYQCYQCKGVYKSRWDLECHGCGTGHRVFLCDIDGCEKTYSRVDTYLRHQRTHQQDVQRYPCKYCKKYRGSNGFKRRDHLTQHLRGYHHIEKEKKRWPCLNIDWRCPHKECPQYRSDELQWGDPAFPKRADYINHMRKVHDESNFPCPEPGCNRVRAKGYFREAALRAYLRKVHGTDGRLEGDTE